MNRPIIISVGRGSPPFPLGQFPKGTIGRIAADIVYVRSIIPNTRLGGCIWEEIFANSIDAEWQPSLVHIDAVRVGASCCWEAKSVKSASPSATRRVKLLSSRNPVDYEFYYPELEDSDPDELGRLALGIWNQRVSLVRQRFSHYRTVVLVKSNDLLEYAVFEMDTQCYRADLYRWKWSSTKALQGYDEHGRVKFSWQPRRGKFTIIEDVPPERLAFKLRAPEQLPRETALEALGFDDSWVTIL